VTAYGTAKIDDCVDHIGEVHALGLDARLFRGTLEWRALSDAPQSMSEPGTPSCSTSSRAVLRPCLPLARGPARGVASGDPPVRVGPLGRSENSSPAASGLCPPTQLTGANLTRSAIRRDGVADRLELLDAEYRLDHRVDIAVDDEARLPR
jgi:hypothetical protein